MIQLVIAVFHIYSFWHPKEETNCHCSVLYLVLLTSKQVHNLNQIMTFLDENSMHFILSIMYVSSNLHTGFK